MIHSASDVGFVPDRVAKPIGSRDGIAPSTASIIVREFVDCPECGHDIDPDVKRAVYEDRDVLWDDELFQSSSHECAGCGATLRIFVEEKAFGVIGASLPDYAESSPTTHFVECDETGCHVLVNTNQIFIHEQ